MKHEKTRALFNYWDELRSGRWAPYRSEVEPRAIAPLLESTFILEHTGDTTPRFRLAGTRLCEQFGMELRGMSALALWHGECRRRMRALLTRVVREPCVGHVLCTVETRGGALYEAEFIYLPLRSDLGEMSRILGCGYYMGGREGLGPEHEPIHHWVDALKTYPIDAPLDADAPIAPGALGGGRDPHADKRPDALNETLRALRQELRDQAPGTAPNGVERRRTRTRARALRPQLQAIEGGRAAEPRGVLDADAPRPAAPRGHLRLVK